jgi:Ca-activated chloride channel family protein
VAWITEFTDDRENFMARLNVQEGYGQTALFDALAATPGLVDAELGGRKAIVLITDGTDNASRMNTLKAVQVARKVNVPIYIIGFRSLADEMLKQIGKERGLPVLQRFSDETGGTMFSVYDPSDLKEAVLRIQKELRFQYVIGYYPTRNRFDGTFRRVQLDTDRRRHEVRTRSGYYADP